jgi:tetratricopeptide (TPR) repeat protein
MLTGGHDMSGLSMDLWRQCRDALLNCDEFGSHESLEAVFGTPDSLRPFLPGLPRADSREDRVTRAITYLLEKRTNDGKPVLAILIDILCHKRATGDAHRNTLCALQKTVDQALSQGDSFDAAPTAYASNSPASIPKSVPPLTEHFIDRAEEMQKIRVLAGQKRQSVGIFGMVGEGKSALARQAFSEIKESFQDAGFAWFDVREKNLSQMIRLLALEFGVEMPEHLGLEEQKVLFRRAFSSRRPLILLDNISSHNQVARELTELAPSSVFIITSTTSMRIEGMADIVLKPLQHEHAKDLFVRICDTNERIAEDYRETYVSEICRLLGDLPLAIVIAASRIRMKRCIEDRDVRTLYSRTKLLEWLKFDDLSVRASFDLSFEDLTDEEKSFFSLLGLFSGDDFAYEAVEAVAESSNADEHLLKLAEMSLITPLANGRYRIHPLLKSYAQTEVLRRDAHDDLFRKLAVYFLQHATVNRHPLHRLDADAEDIFQCVAWCEKEMLGKGTCSLNEFLMELLGADEATSARVVYLVGRLNKRRRKIDVARQYYDECLAIARHIGDRALEAASLRSIGELHLVYLNKHDEGIDYVAQAMQACSDCHDVQTLKERAFTLNFLVTYYRRHRRPELAERWARESLMVRDQIPQNMRPRYEGLSFAAVALIDIYRERGEPHRAYDLLMREKQNLETESDLPISLGLVGQLMAGIGQHAKAEELFHEASRCYENNYNWGGVAWTRSCLAELRLAQRQLDVAVSLCRDALQYRRRAREPHHELAAQLDLARASYVASPGNEALERLSQLCKDSITQLGNASGGEMVCVAESLCRCAQTLCEHGAIKSATSALTIADELYEAANNYGGRAYAQQLQGRISLMQNDLPGADSFYDRAVTFRRQAGERHELIQALEEIGGTYRDHGYVQQARRYYDAWRSACQEQDGRAEHVAVLDLIVDGTAHKNLS